MPMDKASRFYERAAKKRRKLEAAPQVLVAPHGGKSGRGSAAVALPPDGKASDP